MNSDSVEYQVTVAGLRQMGVSGLKRLKRWLDAGGAVLLDGMIYDEEYGLM